MKTAGSRSLHSEIRKRLPAVNVESDLDITSLCCQKKHYGKFAAEFAIIREVISKFIVGTNINDTLKQHLQYVEPKHFCFSSRTLDWFWTISTQTRTHTRTYIVSQTIFEPVFHDRTKDPNKRSSQSMQREKEIEI